MNIEEKIMSGVSGTGLSRMATQNFSRFTPQPRNTAGIGFQDVLKAAGSVVSSAAPVVTGLDGGYQALIAKQIEVQQQMQLMTMHSNIEKSKHETQMSAIRNMRAA